MEHYAILIGVSKVDNERHYKRGAKFQLNQANHNVKLFKSFLCRQGYNILSDDCLVDDKATWYNLKKRLNYYSRDRADENFNLVIFFSGHGVELISPKNYLFNLYCFYDKMVFKGLIQKELKKIDERKNVFLVIDSCYSGGFGLYLISELDNIIIGSKRNDYLQYMLSNEQRDILYNAQIARISSTTSKDEINAGGQSSPTPFLNGLVWILRSVVFNGTASHLSDCLNEILKLSTIYKDLSKTPKYFKKVTPIKFKTRTNLNFKCNMNWTIKIETPTANDQLVNADLNHELQFQLSSETPPIYIDRSQLSDNYHPKVRSFLNSNSNFNNVKGIMLVRIFPVNNGGGSTSLEITDTNSAMKHTKINSDFNGGAVIIINSDLDVEGGVPVKGEVGNSQGGN